MSEKTKRALFIVLLFVTFFVYSLESVFSKLASGYETLSLKYCLFFGCVIAVLGIYAILWQIILKLMPLNRAFPYKSLSIIYILLFSVLLFGETITINNIIGASLIIIGLIVLSWKAN